jgi:YjjG family noncanonical pyrimidine nucleotidase
LFDADGTLFDYDRAESLALGQCLEELGVGPGPEHLAAYRRINREQWQALERGETTPGRLKVRRFELLLEACGAEGSAERLSERYVARLGACSELIDGAERVVRRLRQVHRLAILTNGLQAVQRGRLAGSAIRDCIDALVISEEVGAAKPARAYFEAAFERLGRPHPAETLMIGDNWSSDMQGAADFGIECCWYNPGGLARPERPAIAHEIRSLEELIPIVLGRRG